MATIVTGIFKSRNEALQAVNDLRATNIKAEHIGFLSSELTEEELEARARITDSERPGLGKAMGAVVGGAIGTASGATAGAAAASLLVPGVGPVIAAGVLGAALLGTAGAATGAVAGEATEEFLGEGLPHEDLFVYEDALRKGQSVVVAFVDDSDQDQTKEIMRKHGSLDVDALRDTWWQERRSEERLSYQAEGGDFDRDEENYRRGFQAALHSKRRGKPFDDVQQDLRNSYDDGQLDTAFRQGYERGRRYQATVVESYKA